MKDLKELENHYNFLFKTAPTYAREYNGGDFSFVDCKELSKNKIKKVS